MDLETRIKACMLSWVRRIILSPESTSANLIKVFCGETTPVLIWAAKRDFSSCLSQTSPFYWSVLKMWQSFHNNPPVGEEQIWRELIWNNPRVPSLSEHRSRQRWIRWIDAGILSVQNLCHPSEDRLMGQEEIESTYSFKPTFLEALAIRNAIPLSWKRAITKNFNGDNEITYDMSITGQEFDLMNSSPKVWYRALIKGKEQEIKRQHRWIEELSSPGVGAQIDWEATNALPFKITRETKLQSFHFRIAHRIITCNKYLRDIRILENATCGVYGETDSILHFFISCPPVAAFWASLNGWCENFLGLGFDFLNLGEKILGMTNENGNPKTFTVVNWLLLTAKFYIHRQRLFHKGDMSLIAYLAEIRRKLCVEQRACRWEGKPSKFRTWEGLFAVLHH